MRKRLLGVMIVSALLLSFLPASADQEEVGKHIDDYFREFNEVRAPEYLAETYLSSPLTIISSGGVLALNSKADVAGWLRQVQENLAADGWVRSELLESRTCMSAENVAVFSMKLARVGGDGSTVVGATYTLFKSDRWRIATILVMHPDRLLRCGPAS